MCYAAKDQAECAETNGLCSRYRSTRPSKSTIKLSPIFGFRDFLIPGKREVPHMTHTDLCKLLTINKIGFACIKSALNHDVIEDF